MYNKSQMNGSQKVKIGVFDSGMGGLSVANAITKALPDYEVMYREDKEHVPYGSRTPDEILGFVIPIFQKMVDDGCSVIVIACNTVTTTLIGTLRDRFLVPLVGIEPMVKPASEMTKSRVFAVCATPVTLRSDRYRQLKEQYAVGMTVLEPDCSNWARMIEHDEVDDEAVGRQIETVINQGADVIVLACTHYHWIEEKIIALAAGRAIVLQPEQAIVRRLKHVLQELEPK